MAKKVIIKKNISFLENFKKWPLYIYLLVFAVYGNTIFNNYALDDEFVIKNNKQVHQGIKAIPEIFFTQYFQNKTSNFGYRPLTKSIFAIEYQFFGESPKISHFINVLLFALTCTLLLKLLIKIILPKTGPAFILIAMLIWILHPIHTEVVASLKNREELLYLLFCLLSLKYFISFIEKQKWYFLLSAISLYILSFLTKQSAISFALIIPMVLWFLYIKVEPITNFIKNNSRIILSVILLFIVTYILYKIPNWFFPTDKLELLSFENPLRFNNSIAARLSLSAYAMLINIKLLFIPHPLVFYYGQFTIPEVKLTDFWVIFSLILHAIILFFTIKYLKNKSILLFGTLFYFLGILPFSNYFMELNGIVAERFLYAPSIGFAITFTFLLFKITKTANDSKSFKTLNNYLKYIVIIIVIVFSIKTIARNSTWKDGLTLYSNDIKYLDNSVKANDILAQEMMDMIMREISLKKSFTELKPSLDSIVFLYNRTLALFPNNPKALNNVGNLYINFYNKPELALEYIKKAYSFKQSNFEITFNLGQCYEMLKKNNEAIKYYTLAINIDPTYTKTWQQIINLYYKQGLPDSAKNTCETMLTKIKNSEIPYVGLGYYYISNKDTINAIKNWEKAVEIDPQNYERTISLYNYFIVSKDTLKAKFYYQKAMEAKRYKLK